MISFLRRATSARYRPYRKVEGDGHRMGCTEGPVQAACQDFAEARVARGRRTRSFHSLSNPTYRYWRGQNARLSRRRETTTPSGRRAYPGIHVPADCTETPDRRTT